MIPDKPGIYWRFGPNHDNEMVEQVVKVDILSTNSDDLFYWEHGRIGGIFVKEEEGVEWSPCDPNPGWAHFWVCPHCNALVPAYIEFCRHENVPVNT